MRCLVGFVLAWALAAAPVTASAQASEPAVAETTSKARHGPRQMRFVQAERLFWDIPQPSDVGSQCDDPEFALLLIPEHLQQRVPGASSSASLRYNELEPDKPDPQQRRRMRLGLGIGLGLGIPLIIAAGMGAAIATMEVSY